MRFGRTVAIARLAILTTLAMWLATQTSLAAEPDWLAPPGWHDTVSADWLTPDAANSWTIRGQEQMAAYATQSSFSERRPSFGAPPRRGSNAPTTQNTSLSEPSAAPITRTAAPTPTTPPSTQVRQRDFTIQQPPEVGSVIAQADEVQTVNFAQRSLLSREPYVRSYRDGEIYTLSDGMYWGPIRPDLDSMINRIDPSLYKELSIIPGPYGLRYGPGFTYLNVQTVNTPRFQNGYESRYRTGISTRTNGGQLYGRQMVSGGSSDWGYIVQYGNRVGGDYRPGGNSSQPPIPGSYNSQSFLAQVGFDLSPDSSVEFRYRRLDDTGTQYALQFFDVDYMGSDAYSVHYNWDDPCGDGSLSAMAWYSRSRMNGDTVPPNPSPYDTIGRVEASLDDFRGNPAGTNQFWGQTAGRYDVSGARLNRTWGSADATQLSAGVDVRYIQQRISENFDFYLTPGQNPNDRLSAFETGLPNAYMIDPGAYTELTHQWQPYLSSTLGARVDWTTTSIDPSEIRQPRSNLDIYRGGLAQNDVLLAFYLANDLEMSQNWNLRLAGGYAERPPTLLERYADGVFLSVAQSGYSRVIGTPNLKNEGNWQVDLAVDGEGDCWRARAAAFYGWTTNPITFLGFPIHDPTGAYLIRYINGDLFTRTGFELNGELDHTAMISSFATVHYLSGRDRNVVVNGVSQDYAMTGIFPLDSRVGVRVHDQDGGNKWGVELGVRMVASQNSTGILRRGFTSITGIDPNFEQATPGFTTVDIRTYYNVTQNLYIVGGLDNLFDRTYIEHLNLRLPKDTIGGANFASVGVLAPGITPYIGVEWNY